MFLFRFMSRQEYELLVTGHTLVNMRRHADCGARTSSVGFCFGEISNTDYDGLAEVKLAYHYLSGLVCPEVCCVFRVDEDADLRPSKGEYTAGTKNEWCATRYSLKMLKLKFVCFNILPSGCSYQFHWRKPRCANKMPENRINARNDSQFLCHLATALILDGCPTLQAAMIVNDYRTLGLWFLQSRVPMPDYATWCAATRCASLI